MQPDLFKSISKSGEKGYPVILGLDPSLTSTGYCITNKYRKVIDYGVVKTNSNNLLCVRVYKITNKIEKIIKEYTPNMITCEDQFAGKNYNTLKKLSHVRGQMMYLASKHKLPMYIYTPGQIKKAIANHGRASKEKVANALRNRYGQLIENVEIDLVKKDNISDAIGAALTYFEDPKKGKRINNPK